jgi:toxin YoeB
VKIIFHPEAWEEYLLWQANDRPVLRKLNRLIEAITRDPYEGIGKPEPLRFDYTGYWSRRITDEHRLIYKVEGDALYIVQCRYHYNDS